MQRWEGLGGLVAGSSSPTSPCHVSRSLQERGDLLSWPSFTLGSTGKGCVPRGAVCWPKRPHPVRIPVMLSPRSHCICPAALCRGRGRAGRARLQH